MHDQLWTKYLLWFKDEWADGGLSKQLLAIRQGL